MPSCLFAVYRIRHKETGLFSKGGTRLTFTKQGKVWTKLAYVKSHLTMIKQYSRDINTLTHYAELCRRYLASIEVVEFSSEGERVIDVNDL